MNSCTGLDPAVSSVLAAKESALRARIDTAVLAKQLDATEAQGAALHELLEQAAQLSKSLDSGAAFDAVG
jgi:hypothetical protein